VASGEAEVFDTLVQQPVESGDLEGTYTIAFRVVSTDGHPVSGTLHFSVGHASPPVDDEQTTTAATGDTSGGNSFISEHVASLTVAVAALTLALCLVILRSTRSRSEQSGS
jgi:hypothetical protein